MIGVGIVATVQLLNYLFTQVFFKKIPCSCKEDNMKNYQHSIKFPQYGNVQTRIQSFHFPFKWPPSIPMHPADLAECGFFYEGISDRVVCFTCGGELHAWRVEDNAYDEHAQWFPNCDFIKNLNRDM